MPRRLVPNGSGSISYGLTVLILRGDMNPTSITFKKTASCPSSYILLSYRVHELSPEIRMLVAIHLGSCDFCSAEVSLLAHHKPPCRGECKPPEIPINLRLLAEALFVQAEQIRSGQSKDA